MQKIPKKGYLAVVRGFGIPILVHWSFPISGLIVSFVIREHSPTAVISIVAAYVILILIHETGHAIAAKYCSLKVHGLIITGAGGWCVADKPATRFEKLLFYSGGLLAQGVLFVSTLAVVLSVDKPPFPAANYFTFVFLFVNIVIAILNLIPTEGTDGKFIWQAIRSR